MKGLYSIGVVAELLTLHPQTIRKYERLGFLQPHRSKGNTRLYSDSDLDRLRLITQLTQDMGINHAGVEMIIHMQEEMLRMEEMLDKLNERVQEITSPLPPLSKGIKVKVKRV
jgi:MerR family transcriptional regulator/heat shock protein HspR